MLSFFLHICREIAEKERLLEEMNATQKDQNHDNTRKVGIFAGILIIFDPITPGFRDSMLILPNFPNL